MARKFLLAEVHERPQGRWEIQGGPFIYYCNSGSRAGLLRTLQEDEKLQVNEVSGMQKCMSGAVEFRGRRLTASQGIIIESSLPGVTEKQIWVAWRV